MKASDIARAADLVRDARALQARREALPMDWEAPVKLVAMLAGERHEFILPAAILLDQVIEALSDVDRQLELLGVELDDPREQAPLPPADPIGAMAWAGGGYGDPRAAAGTRCGQCGSTVTKPCGRAACNMLGNWVEAA